jgi:hypothetical protein
MKFQNERMSGAFVTSNLADFMIQYRFFRFCYDTFSPNAAQIPAEDFPIFVPRQATRVTTMPNGIKGDEEVEMITDFSWRNFFAIINVIKIMHKITKSNPTRIQQLVHHKASVSVLSSKSNAVSAKRGKIL